MRYQDYKIIRVLLLAGIASLLVSCTEDAGKETGSDTATGTSGGDADADTDADTGTG